VRDYRKLQVWEKAHRLTLEVYRRTEAFPTDERFGLALQMRRSAVSIPSNIAEGCGRGSDADFARFARIAAGSANELEYQCTLAGDLGYLPLSAAEQLIGTCAEVRRMLSGLIDALAQQNGAG